MNEVADRKKGPLALTRYLTANFLRRTIPLSDNPPGHRLSRAVSQVQSESQPM
jgi:hypothetical protein